MTKREEAVYVAYTSVIEGTQAGFNLEVQPGGAGAGPGEGCLLTCLPLLAQNHLPEDGTTLWAGPSDFSHS